MNKKGGEKTISVYWFAILVIVTGAVIYMVTSVYGEPYDVRELESGILAKNIADCISEGGYLKEKTLGESSFAENFMEVCNLNFESGDFPESEGEYYLELNAYDFDTGSNAGFDVSKGNANLKSNCGLKGKTLPVCLNKSFYLIGKNQKSYRIDIISIINKADENV